MRFSILAALVLLPLFSQAPDAIYRDAVRLQQEGKLDEAVAKYQEVLRLRPNSVAAHTNLGSTLARLGRYDDAITHYKAALKTDPENPGIHMNLGLAYYKQGQISAAIGEFEFGHGKQPENLQIALLLADSYALIGDDAKVLELLDPFERKDPNIAAVNYLLGSALIHTRQLERGQVVIDRVLRNGESAETLMLISTMQLATTENKKAVATLEKASSINPDVPGVWSLLGQAKLNDGDAEGAKTAFLKELEKNPNDWDSNINLGAMYRVDKDYELAAKYLNKARQLRPQSIALMYQLGSLEVALGNNEKALALLEQVTREAPTFVEGHITLASLYYKLKRKADGDRERAIVTQLNAENQKKDLKQ
jgi:tetratricopeptide (TPR) repeat protein